MMEVGHSRETTLTGAVGDETPVSVFVMGPLSEVVVYLPAVQITHLLL